MVYTLTSMHSGTRIDRGWTVSFTRVTGLWYSHVEEPEGRPHVTASYREDGSDCFCAYLPKRSLEYTDLECPVKIQECAQGPKWFLWSICLPIPGKVKKFPTPNNFQLGIKWLICEAPLFSLHFLLTILPPCPLFFRLAWSTATMCCHVYLQNLSQNCLPV